MDWRGQRRIDSFVVVTLGLRQSGEVQARDWDSSGIRLETGLVYVPRGRRTNLHRNQ